MFNNHANRRIGGVRERDGFVVELITQIDAQNGLRTGQSAWHYYLTSLMASSNDAILPGIYFVYIVFIWNLIKIYVLC
jgi:hypothetical protein